MKTNHYLYIKIIRNHRKSFSKQDVFHEDAMVDDSGLGKRAVISLRVKAPVHKLSGLKILLADDNASQSHGRAAAIALVKEEESIEVI